MIFRSISIFVLLCALFSFFLAKVNPQWQEAQNQWHRNEITIEDYLFQNDCSEANIIVGTSLSKRLVMEEFPSGYLNLGMGGLTVYDGIELVMESGCRPERIFIESNLILKEAGIEAPPIRMDPFTRYLKSKLKIARASYQPIPLLVSHPFIKNTFMGDQLNREAYKRRKDSEADQEIKEYMIRLREKEFNEIPTPSEIDATIEYLSELVNALHEKNIEVIFFEVPVEGRICNLPKSELSRVLISKNFSTHHFIPSPLCGTYTTTDGLHLGRAEAIRYSRYLYEYIDHNIFKTTQE